MSSGSGAGHGEKYASVPSAAFFEATASSPPTTLGGAFFWRLRVIRDAVTDGVHLSPQVFCHPDVWRQDGAKLKGLPLKLSSIHAVLKSCQMLRGWIVPSLPELKELVHSPRKLRVALQHFAKSLAAMEKPLRQAFSFRGMVAAESEAVAPPASSTPVPAASASEGEELIPASVRASFTQVTKFGAGLFSMARKGAATAMGRMSVIATRVKVEELKRYTTSIVRMVDALLELQVWLMAALGEVPIPLTCDKHKDMGEAEIAAWNGLMKSMYREDAVIRASVVQAMDSVNDTLLELLFRDLRTLTLLSMTHAMHKLLDTTIDTSYDAAMAVLQ